MDAQDSGGYRAGAAPHAVIASLLSKFYQLFDTYGAEVSDTFYLENHQGDVTQRTGFGNPPNQWWVGFIPVHGNGAGVVVRHRPNNEQVTEELHTLVQQFQESGQSLNPEVIKTYIGTPKKGDTEFFFEEKSLMALHLLKQIEAIRYFERAGNHYALPQSLMLRHVPEIDATQGGILIVAESPDESRNIETRIQESAARQTMPLLHISITTQVPNQPYNSIVPWLIPPESLPSGYLKPQ